MLDLKFIDDLSTGLLTQKFKSNDETINLFNWLTDKSDSHENGNALLRHIVYNWFKKNTNFIVRI